MNEFRNFSLPTARFKRLRDFLVPLSVQEKLIRRIEKIPGFQMKVVNKETFRDDIDSVWVVPYPFINPVSNITEEDYELYSPSLRGNVTKSEILNNRIGRYQNRFLPKDRLDEFDNSDSKFSIVHIYSGDINIVDRKTIDISKTVLYLIPERLPALIRLMKNIAHIKEAPDQEILDNAYKDCSPEELDGADTRSLIDNARSMNIVHHLEDVAEVLLDDRYLLGIQVYGYDGEEDDELLGTTPEAIHTKEQMDIITEHLIEGIKNKDKVILIV